VKRPRPTVVEKLQAQRVENTDLHNVLVAARLGLQALRGQDLVNVSLAMARIEAVLQAAQPKPDPAPEPKPEG
jgi:hypothetical protein